MKKTLRKLVINHETIRVLAHRELANPVGGAVDAALAFESGSGCTQVAVVAAPLATTGGSEK
jgi:hypothetical protein